jgi:hypothetical protein
MGLFAPTPLPPPDDAGIGLFFVHTVSAETFEGTGAYGDSYGAPVSVTCFVDDGAHLVRNKTGEEVVSSTTVYAPPSQAAALALESRVTVNGRVAYVIAVNSRDSGGLGLPDHVEVHLT